MIDPLLRGLESVFSWLVEASWQASVLVALVLLLQVVLRGRLNPRWHHALWLLVIARLMLPFLPESALSLYQFAPPPPAKLAVSMSEPLFAPGPLLSPIEFPTVKSEAVEGGHSFTFYSLLALIWLTGAVALLILTWKVNRRFARHVAASPLVTDPRLINLAVAAQQELGVHRWLRIIESPQVKSPAIMGLFRPTLILPRDVRARFADSELRFIFLHEFAHLRRGDLFLQWLVALLQILHWFNPVLWYAFRRMRADREPATDALVLSCTGETDKESYGQVLVKLLEHYHTRNSLPTLVGILEDKDQFKRRFSLIARFTSGAYGWSILGVLLIVFLSVACLTKSKATESSAPASRVVSTSAADTVASKPTSASVSAPAVDASKRQIQLEFKLIEIDEKTYLSHRSDIDRAVANFDLVSLVSAVNHLPGTALLSAPVVTTQDGLKANVDFLREMPYVTRNDKDKDGKMVPSDFKIRHLGLSILTLPTLMADGTTVDLWFMCHVGSFRGWKEASPGVKQPVFDTVTTNEKILMPERGCALWVGGPGSTRAYLPNGNGIDEPLATAIAPKRILLLVTALPVHAAKDLLGSPSGSPPPLADKDAPDTAAANRPLDAELVRTIRENIGLDKIGHGTADKVSSLLARGANPNARDAGDAGVPALIWALNFGLDDAAVLLLQHGADPNTVDPKSGARAIWYAANTFYCPRALELMIQKGGDVNQADILEEPLNKVIASSSLKANPNSRTAATKTLFPSGTLSTRTPSQSKIMREYRPAMEICD